VPLEGSLLLNRKIQSTMIVGEVVVVIVTRKPLLKVGGTMDAVVVMAPLKSVVVLLLQNRPPSGHCIVVIQILYHPHWCFEPVVLGVPVMEAVFASTLMILEATVVGVSVVLLVAMNSFELVVVARPGLMVVMGLPVEELVVVGLPLLVRWPVVVRCPVAARTVLIR
jgi:hypothetical protein